MAGIFFSIIVAALNPGEKIKRTLDSVLEQEYGNFEILIKDGMSADGSMDDLPRDSRISLFRQPDTGIYDAMNQAVKAIQGTYVLFLNCGDLLYDPLVLGETARFIENMAEKEAQLSAGEARRQLRPQIFYGNQYNELQDTVVSSPPYINDFTCYRNVPCHQVCFYDSRLFEERGYDPDYKVRADYEHFLYCIYERNAQTHSMPLLIARYEGGGFSETLENRKRSALEHKVITRYYMGRWKAFRYQCMMLATLAPVRTRIAGNPSLAAGYNKIKSAVYRRK